MAYGHFSERRRRKNVGVLAADRQHRHAGERAELVPQRRQWLLDLDGGERAGDAHVVGWFECAILHAPAALRGREPLLGGEVWELRVKDLAQNVGAFGKIARLRQLADVAADARQPLRL